MNADESRFTWLNKQGVKSDRGFVVQAMHRFTIEYREGTRKISVYTQSGRTDDGRLCEIIGRRAFERWDDDPSGATIPLERQQEMLANFRAAMEFQGLAVLVEDPVT